MSPAQKKAAKAWGMDFPEVPADLELRTFEKAPKLPAADLYEVQP